MNVDHFLNAAPPRTRRQVLRAALAGAALTVPLARAAAPARAAGPHACQKGCLFTAGQRFNLLMGDCLAQHIEVVQYGLFYPYIPTLAIQKLIDAVQCGDRATLKHKAASFDCSQPGCPGFNPSAPGGPCDSCKDHCCTCSASPNGYICCIFDCADPDHQCCPGG